jgi:hypothetical protein
MLIVEGRQFESRMLFERQLAEVAFGKDCCNPR